MLRSESQRVYRHFCGSPVKDPIVRVRTGIVRVSYNCISVCPIRPINYLIFFFVYSLVGTNLGHRVRRWDREMLKLPYNFIPGKFNITLSRWDQGPKVLYLSPLRALRVRAVHRRSDRTSTRMLRKVPLSQRLLNTSSELFKIIFVLYSLSWRLFWVTLVDGEMRWDRKILKLTYYHKPPKIKQLWFGVVTEPSLYWRSENCSHLVYYCASATLPIDKNIIYKRFCPFWRSLQSWLPPF